MTLFISYQGKNTTNIHFIYTLQIGSKWFNGDCSEQYTCKVDGTVDTEDFNCDKSCIPVEGKLQCTDGKIFMYIFFEHFIWG